MLDVFVPLRQVRVPSWRYFKRTIKGTDERRGLFPAKGANKEGIELGSDTPILRLSWF